MAAAMRCDVAMRIGEAPAVYSRRPAPPFPIPLIRTFI